MTTNDEHTDMATLLAAVLKDVKLPSDDWGLVVILTQPAGKVLIQSANLAPTDVPELLQHCLDNMGDPEHVQ